MRKPPDEREREELRRLLEEGYKATANDDADLNQEWEAAIADGLDETRGPLP